VRRGASWTAAWHLQLTVAAVSGPVLVVLATARSWFVGRPDGGCPAERPAGTQRSGVVAGPRPGCPPIRFRRPGPAVQPSSVQPPGVQRVWCPARPVSSASGVQPVWCPAVRCPAGCCPAVRCPAGCCPPRSVRTRPSRPTPGGGGDQVEAVGNRHHRNGSSPAGLPRLGAARWTAEQAGRGRGCRGRVGQWGSVADPGRGVGGWRRRRLTAERPGRPGRRAERPWLAAGLWARERAAARGGRTCCMAAALGLGGRPRWVVVVGPAARVGRARRGQWACRRGSGCGPSAAQAGGGRFRLAAGSAVTCGNGWWACQDLNLGPHPDPKIHGERARGSIRAPPGSDQRGAGCPVTAGQAAGSRVTL
jgi:hypothetical protein